MQERAGDYFEDKEMASNVKRYEAMMKSGVFTYFDVEEIENVINFYIDNNQLKKAQDACASGLSIHPTSQDLKLKNAQIYVGRGLANEALQWLNKVKELGQGSHEYYLTKGMAMVLLNDAQKAEKYFNSALNLVTELEREDALFNIGDALENSGNFILAIDYYEIGSNVNPENEEFYFRLGFCYDRSGIYEKSIEYYQKYLDFNPFSENVWYNLGIIYNKIEDYKNSIDAYEYAIALDNTHYDALFNKANALANFEMHSEAIAAYQEYLALHENSLTAKYYIGECYIQLKEFDKALEYFDAILIENAEFAEAYYGKAMVYDDLLRYEEAIELYFKAIELDAENTDAWFSLGSLFVKLERFEEAVNAFNQAVAINKFDIEAWLLNADTYDKMENTAQSIGLLIEAVDFLPDSSDILYALAAYYYKSGNWDLGLQWFKNAFELDNENFEIVFKIHPEAEQNKEIMKLIGHNKK
jgi:tetratricopeptide (TPR) repeat protein